MKIYRNVMLLFALSLLTSVAFAQTTKVNDSELKKNAAPISGALGYVNRLEPVTYNFNTQQFRDLKLPSGTQYGFMADNVQDVLPGVVKTESKLVPAGKNAYRSAEVKVVDMQSLVPVLLGAIKEQQQQIESLKAEVQSLKQNHASISAAPAANVAVKSK